MAVQVIPGLQTTTQPKIEYEAINFSQTEAKFSRAMAKFFSCLSCKIWIVSVPEVTNRIADKGKAFRIVVFGDSIPPEL